MNILRFIWELFLQIVTALAKLFQYDQRDGDETDIPEEHYCGQPADPEELFQRYEEQMALLAQQGIAMEPLVTEENRWPAIDRSVLVMDDVELGEIYTTALEDINNTSPTIVEIPKPLLDEIREDIAENTEIGNAKPLAQMPHLNVALVEDTGSMLTRNPVDFVGKSILFTRKGNYFFDFQGLSPGQYNSSFEKVSATAGGFKIPISSDNASHHYKFKGAFSFRLYNKTYRSVYVNSNGNLTFTKGDARPTIDKWEFRDNLPSIAPLWTDLDASQGGEIILHESKDQLVITWVGIPLKGSQKRCRFQAVLFDDGKTNKITFSYKSADADRALVGVSPGDKSKSLSPRDLYDSMNLSKQSAHGCIYEELGGYKDLNVVEVAKAFYKDYDDDYDTLVMFSDEELTAPLYSNWSLFNDIEGIGLKKFDHRNTKLGKGFSKVTSFIKMGSAQALNDHPYKLMPNTVSWYGIHLLAHEQGHNWLAFTQYWDGSKMQPSLSNGIHWLRNVHTRAVVPPWGGQGKHSVMKGATWSEVKGSPGVFARALKGEASFSSLDLYLMGLRSTRELIDAWFIQTSTPVYNQLRVKGKRVDLDQHNLADWDGKVRPRDPNVINSQKYFRSAFILVHEKGKKPDPKMVARVARYAAAWEIYFHAFSEMRAVWLTHLTPRKKKIYVNGLGNDGSGDGSQTKPFRTLTKAISKAKPGSTIHLGAGTYDAAAGEKFPIVLPANVWVEGLYEGSIIRGEGTHTIDGKAYQTTIVAPMHAKLCLVVVENNAGGACLLFDNGEPHILGCKFTTSTKGTGVQLVGSSSGFIMQCHILDNQVGIEVLGDKPCGPTISGNFVEKNKKAGLLYKGKSSPHVSVNIFQENDIGVEGHGTYNPRFAGNEILLNRIGVWMVDTWLGDFGVGGRSSPGGNTFFNNTDVSFWNQTRHTYSAKNNVWENTPVKTATGNKPPSGGKLDIFNSGGGKVDY